MRFSFFEKKPERIIERKSDEEANMAIQEKVDLRAIKKKLKTPDFREVENLVPAMARLVFKLKDELPDYDAIISDDASGRLPSLFFKKLIDGERLKAQKKPVNHYFVASGLGHAPGTMPLVRKFLDEKKGGLGKVLVVTEYISSGRSIAALINVLEDVGIYFDVAAVSIAGSPANSDLYGRDFRKMFKKYLYYGEIGDTGDSAFSYKPHLGGVKKSGKVDSAHPFKFRPGADEWSKEEIQAGMKTAREDMAMLAEELSKLLE